MPYEWISPPDPSPDTAPGTDADAAKPGELHLWPHQSLTPEGYTWAVAGTGALLLVPLIPVLGTVVLWGLLPFLLVVLFGLKWALDHNRKQAQILEILTLSDNTVSLLRHGPAGQQQSWQANRYWVRVNLHKTEGPIPNYVTLTGDQREVEIGAFLAEEERVALYDVLTPLFQHR